MNKPEYFYELACCNCPEKDRCLEQKEKKESIINALFSYIENESNKITIGEIKNQIPTLTRCDVVLGKQIQRLKVENEKLRKECMQMVNENYASTDWRELEKLKAENEELKEEYKQFQHISAGEVHRLRKAIVEVKQLLTSSMDIKLKSADKHFSLIDEAIEIVNEVLKDE